MSELLEVMQIIDRNSDKLPEGDYLDICNRLKKAYSKRVDPEFFFDYDTFDIPTLGPTEEVHAYFRDYYFDQAIGLDADFISGQVTYLQRELRETVPLKRKTKFVKDIVFRHYCISNDLIPEEETIATIDLSERELSSMVETYIHIENSFRSKYKEIIEKRLEWLEEAEEKLDEM